MISMFNTQSYTSILKTCHCREWCLSGKHKFFFMPKNQIKVTVHGSGIGKKEHRIFVVVGLISNDIWQEFLLLLLCKTRLPDILKLGWFISIWVSRKSKSKKMIEFFFLEIYGKNISWPPQNFEKNFATPPNFQQKFRDPPNVTRPPVTFMTAP